VTDDLDAELRVALDATARALEREAAIVGPERLGEIKHQTPAFRDALRLAGVTDVQPSGAKVALSTWTAGLGAFDVVVGTPPACRALFELKWAATKHELGWTLWDLYKLAAARIEHAVHAYAIVGAPITYWSDPEVDCSAVYCDAAWDSAALFRRYQRAWADLLGGGTARPLRVPASLQTSLIAASAVATQPEWELRALRVDVPDEQWLEFDGDWPVR
jgi:hypothetical protein